MNTCHHSKCNINEHGQCKLELTSQGCDNGSIGPVCSSETLARIVKEHHMNGEELIESFLQRDHLLSDGWSFFRLSMIDEKSHDATVMIIAGGIGENTKVNEAVYAKINAGLLRKVKKDKLGFQPFCIIDDAINFPQHALVVASDKIFEDNQYMKIIKKLRDKILEEINSNKLTRISNVKSP